jgi:hypothetical protein
MSDETRCNEPTPPNHSEPGASCVRPKGHSGLHSTVWVEWPAPRSSTTGTPAGYQEEMGKRSPEERARIEAVLEKQRAWMGAFLAGQPDQEVRDCIDQIGTMELLEPSILTRLAQYAHTLEVRLLATVPVAPPSRDASEPARCGAAKPGTFLDAPLRCSLPHGHEGGHEHRFSHGSECWPVAPTPNYQTRVTISDEDKHALSVGRSLLAALETVPENAPLMITPTHNGALVSRVARDENDATRALAAELQRVKR